MSSVAVQPWTNWRWLLARAGMAGMLLYQNIRLFNSFARAIIATSGMASPQCNSLEGGEPSKATAESIQIIHHIAPTISYPRLIQFMIQPPRQRILHGSVRVVCSEHVACWPELKRVLQKKSRLPNRVAEVWLVQRCMSFAAELSIVQSFVDWGGEANGWHWSAQPSTDWETQRLRPEGRYRQMQALRIFAHLCAQLVESLSHPFQLLFTWCWEARFSDAGNFATQTSYASTGSAQSEQVKVVQWIAMVQWCNGLQWCNLNTGGMDVSRCSKCCASLWGPEVRKRWLSSGRSSVPKLELCFWIC